MALFGIKSFILISFGFSNWAILSFPQTTDQPEQLSWISSLLAQIVKSEQTDFMHLQAVLVGARLIELVNFLFVVRWLSNIQLDIIRFLRLIKLRRQAQILKG